MSELPATIEIEAFRADLPASKGITAATLDEVIASYNAEANPAPLVVGHPESDKPAKGVISGLRRDGEKLFVKISNVAKDAAEGVRKGEFINRSAAFWHPDHTSNPTPGKWNFRHLGLLGAASPGIPGMSKLQFSADESSIEGDAPAPAVVFTAPTPIITIQGDAPVTDTVTKAEFDAAQARADKAEADLKATKDVQEAAVKTAFEADNAAFVTGLAKAGKVLPAHAPVFTALLNALPTTDFEFAADDKAPIGTKVRAILDAAKPQIIFEALTPKGKAVEFDANDKDQLTAAAKAMVKDGKAPTFAAAVIKLSEGA